MLSLYGSSQLHLVLLITGACLFCFFFFSQPSKLAAAYIYFILHCIFFFPFNDWLSHKVNIWRHKYVITFLYAYKRKEKGAGAVSLFNRNLEPVSGIWLQYFKQIYLMKSGCRQGQILPKKTANLAPVTGLAWPWPEADTVAMNVCQPVLGFEKAHCL